MNLCTPAYTQKRGLTLPPLDKLRTYVPGVSNSTMQEILFSVTPTALAKNYCKSQDCKDQIRFQITIGCGIPGDPGDTIVWGYDDTKGAELAQSIICTLNMSPTINAQGLWSVDGTNINYKSLYPGLQIDLDIQFDSTHFEVKRLGAVDGKAGKAVHLAHGTVAHSPMFKLDAGCSSAMDMSGRPKAISPTQDPKAAGSNQTYAGIVVDRPYGTRGNASGTFPFFGDCNDCCPPAPTCVELVCGCCVRVDLAMESFVAPLTDKLFYRVSPSGKFTKMGYFSTTAGDGLVEWPGKFTAIEREGNYLTVELH
jgi:hypothetical protein